MPVWRDPLDEPIADLERTVPAPEPVVDPEPPIGDFCAWVQSLICRDADRRRRLAADPAVRRYNAYHERKVRERQALERGEPPG